MTFSCPHYDIDRDRCWRLKCECVPGRPGCVLRNNSRFAVPVEQRIAETEGGKGKKAGAQKPAEAAAEGGRARGKRAKGKTKT